MTVTSLDMEIDFGQFTLWFEDGARIHLPPLSEGLPSGLAYRFDDGQVILMTATQGGQYVVEVRVEDTPIGADDDWPDFMEFSVTAGRRSSVRSWDYRGGGILEVPLIPSKDYRVRYLIIDGQLGNDHDHSGTDFDKQPPGKYIIQIWPQPATPAVIRATSEWAQRTCQKR